jgi:ATP phosphoribosyltransferase
MVAPLDLPQPLILALSKGRIWDEALPLLAAIGIEPTDDPEQSRLLRLPTTHPSVQLLAIRAQDVPVFVEYGAADAGVAGLDVLMEYQGENLYDPLDLQIARCRMVIAGHPGTDPYLGRPRIATKYLATTRNHFAERGIQAEIIKLYGSMELAPLVGLADFIVDLMDTGNTLRANGLAPLAEMFPVTSRLVVNKAAMKRKHRSVRTLMAALAAAVARTA